MKGNNIKQFLLKNGLMFCLTDESRKIAGDRWYICIKGELEIPVTRAFLPRDEKEDAKAVAQLMGNAVTFEKKLERNFIANDEKNNIQEGFIDAFSRLASNYLDHPDFAKNYMAQCIRKKKQEQTWYR